MPTNKVVPKILFLQEVFLKDCQAYINYPPGEKPAHVSTEYKEYDELKKVFKDTYSWPQSNNLLCWHCSLPFDSVPIFVPKIIEPRNGAAIMNCEGNFCSFHCAAAYINQAYPNVNDNIEAKNKLKYLFSVMNGGRIVREIPPMPPKYLMRTYGGHMTICQYTELCRTLKCTF